MGRRISVLTVGLLLSLVKQNYLSSLIKGILSSVLTFYYAYWLFALFNIEFGIIQFASAFLGISIIISLDIMTNKAKNVHIKSIYTYPEMNAILGNSKRSANRIIIGEITGIVAAFFLF